MQIRFLAWGIASVMLAMSAVSCVPQKMFNALQADYDSCTVLAYSLKSDIALLVRDTTELREANRNLRAAVKALATDTSRLGVALRNAMNSYDQLEQAYALMEENSSSALKKNAEENRKLLRELETMQSELRLQEDSLSANRSEYNQLMAALQEREARVSELERKIAEKDSILAGITARVREALLGYEGKGLQIEERDGKLYLTLDNRLLFASGKWSVNSGGMQALGQLAEVLSNNPDISVLVEGHTDSDKLYGGTEVVDNWDLSVMRATAVAKALENAGVEPGQITASGRGEYFPVASNDTPEGKAKNRRIEIILEPDVSELMKLLNSM